MAVYLDGAYASATAPAQQHALLDEALGRHPAFTRVDEFAPNANSVVTVWRCAGSANGTGRDFHILLWRYALTTDRRMYICMAENYDPTAKAVIRPVPAAGLAPANTTAPASDFSFGGGSALPLGTGTSPPAGLGAVLLQTGDGRLYAVVHNSGLTVFFVNQNGTPTQLTYASTFESFLGADDPLPLILANNGSGWTNRHPYMTAAHGNTWQVDGTQVTAAWTTVSGQMGGNGDRFYNNRPLAARRAVKHIGAPHIFGGVRGLMRDLLIIDTITTQMIITDTVVVNNETYLWTGLYNTWLNLSSP